MTISKDEVLELMCAFHDVVMLDKGDAAAQGDFFLYPDPLIFIPHGEDLSLRKNHQIHQGLADEKHVPLDPWTITQLCDQPERARAIGAVYWEGRPIDSTTGKPIKCIVGEDWIVQRVEAGGLKIVLYINSYHRFLPDSAAIDLA